MLSSIRLGRDRGVRDRVLALKSLNSFADQDDLALGMMAERALYRHFEAGDTIATEGSPIASVHIVLAGQARVTRNGQQVAMVQRGRGIGFLSYLGRDENGVTAVAVEATDTLGVPVDALEDAREEHFSLVRNGIRLASDALVKRRGQLPVDPAEAEPARMGVRPERELTLVERVLRTREGVLFSRCNTDAVVELIRRGRNVTFEPGQIIWREGIEATFYLRVEYGIIDCTTADGRSVQVGEGFTVGVHDCFGKLNRGYTARANTEVIAFQMDIEAMLGVLETHYELAQDLEALLAQQLLTGN